jgi:hypothetical protein
MNIWRMMCTKEDDEESNDEEENEEKETEEEDSTFSPGKSKGKRPKGKREVKRPRCSDAFHLGRLSREERDAMNQR